jgi:hypothetical protein
MGSSSSAPVAPTAPPTAPVAPTTVPPANNSKKNSQKNSIITPSSTSIQEAPATPQTGGNHWKKNVGIPTKRSKSRNKSKKRKSKSRQRKQRK